MLVQNKRRQRIDLERSEKFQTTIKRIYSSFSWFIYLLHSSGIPRRFQNIIENVQCPAFPVLLSYSLNYKELRTHYINISTMLFALKVGGNLSQLQTIRTSNEPGVDTRSSDMDNNKNRDL